MRHLTRYVSFPLLVQAFFTLSLWAQQSQEPCQCSDLENIRYRIQEDGQTIHYLDNELKSVNPNATFTAADFATLQQGIQVMLDAYGGQSAYHSTLPPDPSYTDADCHVSIKPGVSPCMRKVLEIHEAVHVEGCRKGLSWRNYQKLSEAIQEEIRAYQAEFKFLQEQRRRLGCACKHYSLFVSSDVSFNYLAIAAGTSSMKPLEIPIEFSDDGSFTGQKRGEEQVQVNVTAPPPAGRGGGAGVVGSDFKPNGHVRRDPCMPPKLCPPPVMDLNLERNPQTASFTGQLAGAQIFQDQSITCVEFPTLPPIVPVPRTQCKTKPASGSGSVTVQIPALLDEPQYFDVGPPLNIPWKLALTVEIRERDKLPVAGSEAQYVLCHEP